MTRMNKQIFVRLCTRLKATGIVSSTKNMLVDEHVAMTLHILAHHQKQRTINTNFGRSGEIISRHFRQVINSIITLHGELLKTPEPVPNDSTDERWKWFKSLLMHGQILEKTSQLTCSILGEHKEILLDNNIC
ncbi:hypothetical protein ACS0TY_017346 [Phlomoides rotata]